MMGWTYWHLAVGVLHVVCTNLKLKPGRYELKELLQIKLVQADLVQV